MLGRTALKLSAALSRRGIFDTVDTPVYAYGFELVLAAVLDIIAAAVISVLFGKPLAWFFFLLPFIPIRTTAGGYHANTHLGCFLVFIISFTVFICAAAYLPGFFGPVVLSGVSGASFLVVLTLSPIPSVNKPVGEAQKHANRKMSLLISGACVVLSATAFFVDNSYLCAFSMFAFGQLGVSVSLIAAWVQSKREKAHQMC